MTELLITANNSQRYRMSLSEKNNSAIRRDDHVERIGPMSHKQEARMENMRAEIKVVLSGGQSLSAAEVANNVAQNTGEEPHMPTLYANLTWMFWREDLQRSGTRRNYRYRIKAEQSEQATDGIRLLEMAFGIAA